MSILVGVLLAAGQYSSFLWFAVSVGMSEFHNSYVCLSITYIRPRNSKKRRHRPYDRSDMPFFLRTPYLICSELVGAVVMAAFMRIPSGKGRFSLLACYKTSSAHLPAFYLHAPCILSFLREQLSRSAVAIFLGIYSGQAVSILCSSSNLVPLKLA
jgi:hypothetical protein